MKKIYLLALALAVCSSSFAQNFLGMKIKKYGLASTVDQDRVNGLDATYFMGLAKTNVRDDLAGKELPKESITSMTCENPAFRFDITVLPFKASPNIHLNLGTSLMLNRIDATGYSFRNGNYGDNQYEYIDFDSYSNEAALEATMLFSKKLLFVNLYGGAGTNLGYTFLGHMYIEGSYLNNDTESTLGSDGASLTNRDYTYFSERHDMKNSLHQRAYLHAGVSITFFKRLELGVEGRRGIGYRYNTGNPMKFTNLISGGFVARWNLL